MESDPTELTQSTGGEFKSQFWGDRTHRNTHTTLSIVSIVSFLERIDKNAELTQLTKLQQELCHLDKNGTKIDKNDIITSKITRKNRGVP